MNQENPTINDMPLGAEIVDELDAETPARPLHNWAAGNSAYVKKIMAGWQLGLSETTVTRFYAVTILDEADMFYSRVGGPNRFFVVERDDVGDPFLVKISDLFTHEETEEKSDEC